MAALELAQKLVVQFADLLSPPADFRGELTLLLNDAERITEVCLFAKKELGMTEFGDEEEEQEEAIGDAIAEEAEQLFSETEGI